MDNSVILFTMPLIFLVVPLVLALVRARAAIFPDKEVFKFPKFVPILAAFGFIFVVALGIWALSEDDSSISNVVAGYILIAVFLCTLCPASLWLFLMGLNWKLILDKEQLIYRNIWGKVKRLNYQDITGIRTIYYKKSNMVKGHEIYFGKKKITIETLVTNLDTFPIIIKRRLNKFNNKIVFVEKK